ncbi:MAG: lipopolysaccharide biosynthesis protein [Treponema sp.]|nr:lipopolysaccharide biosynthesis protein [Treponema sp.]
MHAADEEISLIDLFAVLLHYKKLIFSIVAGAMVTVLVYSIVSLVLPPEKSPLPNKYTPYALMLINDEASSGGTFASLLSSSGLAGSAFSSLLSSSGLAGGTTYSELAVYLVGMNTFLDAIVDEFDLITRYKINKFPRAASREALKSNLKADYDSKSGVLSLKFSDIDPVFAQSVVNFAANYMDNIFMELGLDKNQLEKKNLEEAIQTSYEQVLELTNQIREKEGSSAYGYNPNGVVETAILNLELQAQEEVYKQLKTQYEILKVTMASEKPVFQILERAEVPDRKSKPSRGKLCIIVTFAALFLSIFIAFMLNALENIKNDPTAMKKLSPAKSRK